MHKHPDITGQLAELLGAQVARYEQAVARAQHARQAYDQRGSAEDELAALQIQMNEIQTADQQLSAIKQAWSAAGRPKNETLQSSLNKLAALIQQLMSEVERLETQTRAERDRLAPALNREAKGRQMVAAYGEASRIA